MLHEAAPRSSVSPESILGVSVSGKPVALYDVDGEVIATTDICPHSNCMLSSSGEAIDGIVECCCHGSSYDLRTGENVMPPFSNPLTIYPSRVDNGMVLVDPGDAD